MTPANCILLLSGGIDSTTVLASLVDRGQRPLCLIFEYGQTLAKEVDVAVRNAAHYKVESLVLRVDLAPLSPTCALLNPNVPIPDGRTPAQIRRAGTPPTYVPFRNGIFLAYAVAIGEARGIPYIYCGGNGLHSGNYYDDTVDFAKAFECAAQRGTSPDYTPHITFPMANIPKAGVVRIARTLGVDLDRTWSCYRNGATPCNTCDSCAQRNAALGPVPPAPAAPFPFLPFR